MLSKSRPNSLFIVILSFIFILSLFVRGSHQQRRYFHYAQQKTWSEAQKYCRENHIDLATFRSKAELDRISGTCNYAVNCWIGLHRDKNDFNVWKWSDGEKSRFTSWSNNYSHRNKYNRNENCVVIASRVWFGLQCHYRRAFLCYEDDLILVKENKTWEEALEHCRTLDTDPNSNNMYFNHLYDLPNLRTGHWNARKLIQDAQIEEVWIGLRYMAGHWLWVNRKRLNGELPACPAAGMYCGTMSKTGDVVPEKNCLERRNFLCSTTN